MPCPFTGPKMFWAGPNFLCQTKNLFTNILCSTKRLFAFSKIVFCAGTKCSQIFGLAQKIWTGTKHFGTCKRTRHYYTSAPQLEPGYFCNSPENSVLGQTSISSKGTNFTSDFFHTFFVNGFKSGIKVIVDFN